VTDLAKANKEATKTGQPASVLTAGRLNREKAELHELWDKRTDRSTPKKGGGGYNNKV